MAVKRGFFWFGGVMRWGQFFAFITFLIVFAMGLCYHAELFFD